MSNLAKLARDLHILASELPEKANEVVRVFAIEALNNLILATPVDTGRARSNWFVNANNPDSSVSQNTDFNSNMSTQVGKLSKLQGFESVWISNNLPYIGVLNDGHSQQAPVGFVEKAVEAAGSAIANAKILR